MKDWMTIGPWRLCTLETSRFLLDGGTMFGVVPRVLWERKVTPDAVNRIPMAARLLVLRGPGRVVVVDTGLGDKLTDKKRAIYGLQDPPPAMERLLAARGLTCEAVTDVILTHLHFDHSGGATRNTSAGRTVPTFPNARYHVQRKQWETAVDPVSREAGSFVAENFRPLEASGQLAIVEGPGPFMEGIDLLVTDGHTPGQQHPLVRGPEGAVFYCADLFPTAAHLPIAWHMAYDTRPLKIQEEKEQILERAVAEGWILVFEHDPERGAATVRRGDRAVEVDSDILF